MRYSSFRGSVVALAAFVSMGLATTAQAQIFTETFNSVPLGTPSAPGTVGGFSLTAGSVDGSTSAGGLLQTSALSLNSGTVTLEFLLAGTQRGQTDSVVVSLGSLFTQTYTRNNADPFTLVTAVITVPVGQTAVLSFNATGSRDNVGLLLDDVVLTQTTVAGTAAPEAGSAALAGMGLLSLAGMAVIRRRSR